METSTKRHKKKMKEKGKEVGEEAFLSPHSKQLLGRIEAFQKKSKLLLDIASCKCTLFTHKACKCPETTPEEERKFLTDQRGVRKMYIGARDIKFVHRRPRPVTQRAQEVESVRSVSTLRAPHVSRKDRI